MASQERDQTAHRFDGFPNVRTDTEFAAIMEADDGSVANAPEHAGEVPAQEWSAESDARRISEMLEESGKRVREAVRGRIEAERPMDRDFAHPAHLVQFLIFHEGYHHGQIKLALKAAGRPLADAAAGPLTWAVWRARESSRSAPA